MSLSRAHQVLAACVRGGMSASAGPRYFGMIWTRDLAIVAPAYVKGGFRAELRAAVRALCDAQSTDTSESYTNGYETFCRYGQVPIVCVPDTDAATCGFLIQRIVGTREDPYWAWQLLDYCRQPHVDMDWRTFPHPWKKESIAHGSEETVTEQLSRFATDAEAFTPSVELRTRLLAWYAELQAMHKRLVHTAVEPELVPRASFALESYMEGRLADLTAGTRDSEIHLVRAMGTLYDAYSDEPATQTEIWGECAPALVRALVYLFGQVVVDADEGLPRGADSRDIFSDLMYDAHLLSNACYLHQVFDRLIGWSRLLALERGSFYGAMLTESCYPIIGRARDRNTFFDKLVQAILELQSEDNVAVLLTQARDELAHKIRQVFFPPPPPGAAPRDFVPGKRAALTFVAPIKASPSNHLIGKYEPDFAKGTVIDPQGVALALLQNLVPEAWLTPQVGCRQVWLGVPLLNALKQHDSAIGITQFVPISGKSQAESRALEQLKGRVVWPHISWLLVRALEHLALTHPNCGAQELADQQRAKLHIHLGDGCGEWYGYDAMTTQQVIQGGDPQQAWSAAGIVLSSQ